MPCQSGSYMPFKGEGDCSNCQIMGCGDRKYDYVAWDVSYNMINEALIQDDLCVCAECVVRRTLIEDCRNHRTHPLHRDHLNGNRDSKGRVTYEDDVYKPVSETVKHEFLCDVEWYYNRPDTKHRKSIPVMGADEYDARDEIYKSYPNVVIHSVTIND